MNRALIRFHLVPTVGAAMEMYEAGYITDKETGGIELKFGSAKALTTWLN